MKVKLAILTAGLVLVAGCGEEETFSRYPSVWVPEYETEDYTRDMSDPNPELVYNAVCNLGGKAKQFGKTLCAEDADPASPEYQRADKIYRAVCMQLESKESYTVAASLRFLQIFAKDYKPKEELVEIVSKVQSSHPQVQFEQAALLRQLVGKSSRLPEPLLRQLLDSPSWIVSRTTYGLIGRLHEEPLRQELFRRYQNTNDEKERLILINALRDRLEPEEASLFEEEMLTTENIRIRRAVGRVLARNAKCPGVQPWFNSNYSQFSEEEKAWLFEDCNDIDLSCQFVAQGYIPDDKDLQDLLKCLADEENTDERAELLRFEEAILANPQLAGRWQTMKDEAEQEQIRMNALREEMAPLSQEFTEKVRALLTKHEMPASDQEKILGKIGTALRP